MNKQTYTITGVVVLAAIIIGALVYYGGTDTMPSDTEVNQNASSTKTTQNNSGLIEGTGDIDATFNMILSDGTEDETPAGANNSAVVEGDAEAASDFGQSLDASQF